MFVEPPEYRKMAKRPSCQLATEYKLNIKL
jgi:hypothetical protein